MCTDWEQTERLKQRVEASFFAACAIILALSCAMFLVLTIARGSIFSEIDAGAFVIPFLGYTFAMLTACLALGFLPLYTHARAAYYAKAGLTIGPYPPSVRSWLYPAAAFVTLTILLFLTATFTVAYLIIL